MASTQPHDDARWQGASIAGKGRPHATARSHPQPTVRLATPFEGPLIGSLLRASGKTDRGVDWNVNVFPYWLIAFLNEAPVGCVQVHYGVPIARVDTMCLLESLAHTDRVRTAFKLIAASIDIARATGAQYVTAGIEEHTYPQFGRFLIKRFGARRIRDAALYVTQVS